MPKQKNSTNEKFMFLCEITGLLKSAGTVIFSDIHRAYNTDLGFEIYEKDDNFFIRDIR